MRYKVTRLFAILMVVTLLAAAAVPALAAQANGNIIEVLQADGRFNTLSSALQQANLVDTLQTGGPYTLFAPTDDAFAALPQDQLNNLLNDPQQLRSLLMYHVISDEVMATDVQTMDTLDTADGEMLDINMENNVVTIGDAGLVEADIVASNGVIHAVDRVLVAPSLQGVFGTQDQMAQPEAQVQQDQMQEGQTQQQDPTVLPQTGGETSFVMIALAALGLLLLTGGMSLYAARNR